MNLLFWLKQGQVLGAQVYRDSAEIVQGVIDSKYRESLSTHDLETVAIALAVVAALGLYQIWVAMRRYRQTAKLEMGRWLGWLVIDIAMLLTIIMVHVYWDYRVVKIEQPRNVKIEKLGDDLVRVQWQTFNQTIGVMSWRYEGQADEQLMIGNEGTTNTKQHEVLLELAPNKELYFYLIVGNKRYGQAENEPYRVDATTTTYQLKEVKTNAK